MKNKLLLTMTLSLLLLWSYQICLINSTEPEPYRYKMGQEINGEFITIFPLEAHLYEKEEFLSVFSLEEGTLGESGGEISRYICLRLRIKNISDKEIPWNRLVDEISCGFETDTWASAVMPELNSRLNLLKGSSLAPEQNQDFWFVTGVNASCFRNKTWNSLSLGDFSYVLTLDPVKISIHLEEDQ